MTMRLDRKLVLGASALLIAGAAGAALAHPHPEGEGDGRTVERIVIIRDGKGGEHAKGERVRRVEIIRDGERHAGAEGPGIRRFEMHGRGALVDCLDGEKVVDESAGDGDRKTKVIICNKGKPSAATAHRLEEALARINANDELSDEQKARIETALRSAIDRARSTR
jgi:hypothetical protein